MDDSAQVNKQIVWEFWQALNVVQAPDIGRVVNSYVHEDVFWQGPHPLNELQGRQNLLDGFWQPLRQAFPDLLRRPYFFIGGSYEGQDWVCGTGDYVGTFAHDWLGIPASKQSIHFRFGEFCRVEDGKITAVYTLFDVLELLRQAGFQLLPPGWNPEPDWVPGPLTGDGLVMTQQDEDESRKSLQLIKAMIFDGLLQYDGRNKESMGIDRYWQPHMVWYGPYGIGTAFGRENFIDSEAMMVAILDERTGGTHKARLADGPFAASTGWPSVEGRHATEFLGIPATGKRFAMRVMDFWKRDGDLLLENWILIDLVDGCLQLGVDLWARLAEMKGNS